MRRREFIAGAAVLATAARATAQEPGRTYRIGVMSVSPRNAPHYVELFERLRRSGFIEGQNLTIDPRGFGLRADHAAEVARELVTAGVNVIQAGGDTAIHAAQQATATIPILGFTDDMVGSGFVHSMARPGGNTTGISILAPELDGKRQEFLIEIVPGARRIAALADPNTTTSQQLQALQDAAHARGIELSIYPIAKSAEIAGAIEAAKTAGVAAVNVLASALLFGERRLIVERMAALRLPAIYQWPETAEEGGLAGYGPRIVQLFRDTLAGQMVKLLRGAKPADLPVQQPTKFELVINLKTAEPLGLTVQPLLLAQADEVIE